MASVSEQNNRQERVEKELFRIRYNSNSGYNPITKYELQLFPDVTQKVIQLEINFCSSTSPTIKEAQIVNLF